LLDKCREKDIRTAVISNNAMSSEGLAVSIYESLPESDMEFVISSADYILCKPAPDMFEAAAKISGLAPEDCWYCGNDGHCDVYGALAGGMYPVFYNRESPVPAKTDKTPDGKEFLVINGWQELIRLLDA
jgi:FMN phosphatase YigB (HAD superfamily)